MSRRRIDDTVNNVAGSSVVIVRWPADQSALEELRSAGVPRLLLIGETDEAPSDGDPLQDWIRLPAGDADLHARITTLEQRASRNSSKAVLPGDGRLSYGGRWVTLSPIGERMLGPLVARFGDVVPSAEMIAAGWPDRTPSEGAPRVQILRIRQALEPIGLELKVVRDRGYVLQPRTASPLTVAPS